MKRRGAGTITIEDVGSRVRLQAWVQRRRDLGGLLFLDLRDRSGVVQVVVRPDERPEVGQALDPRPLRVGGGDRGERRAPRAGTDQPRPADRRGRGDRRARRSCSPAPRRRRSRSTARPRRAEETRLRYRYLDLRRPELQKNFVLRDRGDARDPQLLPRARLPRRRDADPHQVDPRGRARLPGPLARPPRQLLRPAAVAAALQAAPDGGRLRALHPDRPLLPRRGPAGRPPARVHPGRRRDVLPHGGGHLRADRGALRARLPARRHLTAGRRSRA